jgi:hypothetical protein
MGHPPEGKVPGHGDDHQERREQQQRIAASEMLPLVLENQLTDVGIGVHHPAWKNDPAPTKTHHGRSHILRK